MESKNRLKELRTSRGLTLKELGAKVNMRDNTLSQYENGHRQPRLETWQKLADFFGVSVQYLQGTEPDYHEITENTKIAFAYFMNNAYFFDVDSEDMQYISDKYLKSSGVESRPLRNSTNIDFWYKYFGFLLQDNYFLKTMNFNAYADEFQKIIDEYNQNYNSNDFDESFKVKNMSSFKQDIFQGIESELDKKFGLSEFQRVGNYYISFYRGELRKISSRLDEKLGLAYSKQEVEESFSQFNKKFQNIKESLLKDLEEQKPEKLYQEWLKQEEEFKNSNKQ